jgi:hypothetical protein
MVGEKFLNFVVSVDFQGAGKYGHTVGFSLLFIFFVLLLLFDRLIFCSILDCPKILSILKKLMSNNHKG